MLAVRDGQFDTLTMFDLAGRIAVDHDHVGSAPVAPSAVLTGNHDGCVVCVTLHAMTLGAIPTAPSVFLSGAKSWRVGARSRAARREAEDATALHGDAAAAKSGR